MAEREGLLRGSPEPLALAALGAAFAACLAAALVGSARTRRVSQPRPFAVPTHLSPFVSQGDSCVGMAEREGFEPSIRVSPYAGLANLCHQPLGHLSVKKIEGLLIRHGQHIGHIALAQGRFEETQRAGASAPARCFDRIIQFA
jgi:hypothetical protein